MRSLTAALTTAYGAPVQKPAWLVEITWSQSTSRLCSYATVTWNSESWTQEDVDVSGLRVGALSISGALVLNNATDVWGAAALTEGFTDKRIRIWGYDAGIATPDPNDPQLLADARGSGAQIDLDRVRVNLRDPCEYLSGPRAIVAPEFGFHTLLPAGRVLTINGISFVIARSR